ncbi:hypothetical protein D9K79_11615 [Acinetobacter cumulans]|uniref:Uncharacterized protein n=1 Tax=Acinetobacter cumulans TaxID=2136182 RepID=A0ABX9U553_9GAMM|nr:hypothetical protein [Acinetobacter cumulans]RLL43008.1 hypothetical protein D9K79_11615 [Acinetobacter cumulans]
MIKQTQTKMFDFSDTDLDFCGGSKNKFPTVFKKMLAQGYNSKVVSSVLVTGDQITLDYGVNHGYVAGRVLVINTPGLDGEFYIDSVSSNTLTITVQNAPASIDGGFTTKVAPLGYELVYENAHIHIYKFKHIDETDLYLRLCFQTVLTQRNSVIAAIGKSVDLNLGIITDVNSPGDLGTCPTVSDSTFGLRWDFDGEAYAGRNNFSYLGGFSSLGKGCVVGSQYHLLFLGSYGNNTAYNYVYGFLPTHSFANKEELNYPALITTNISTPASSINTAYISSARVYVGKTRAVFSGGSSSIATFMSSPVAASSFLPKSLEDFNTTAAIPLSLYEVSTKQFLGMIIGGLFAICYGTSNQPSSAVGVIPEETIDIDFNTKIMRHTFGGDSNTRVFVAAPIEEIKIVS